MLLFQFRLFSDVAKFCTLVKIREPKTAKTRYRKQQSVCERKLYKQYYFANCKRSVSTCISNKKEAHTPTGDMRWDKWIDVS